MARYDFRCPRCGAEKEIQCKMDEIKDQEKLTTCDECYINDDVEVIMKRVWKPVALINPGGVRGKGIKAKRQVANPYQEFSKDGDVDRVWTEDVKVKKRD